MKNHKNIFNLILICIFALNFIFSQANALDNKNKSQPNKIMEVKEFKLKNGLKVLIKEDHNAPIFSQAVFFKVGSRNDIKGQSGASHYLEHMQFNGTATKPKGFISEEIERRGGSFNAATSTDYTMYYMTLPSADKNLDFSMELEADRMRNSIINDQEAEREREVVLSELMGGENNPATLLSREVYKSLYPTHPYGIPIIGWKDDLLATNGKNLKSHYDQYYRPDNAVLVLVGNIQTQEALDLAKKYFEKIENPKTAKPAEIKPESAPISQSSIQVKSPSETLLIMKSWRIPNFKSEDYIALYALATILSDGELSRLEKALVDTGKASMINASARQGLDPFSFSVIASTPKDNNNLDEIEKIIAQEIEKIKNEGVKPEELSRVKAKVQSSFLFGLEETSDLASQLGLFETMANDWKYTFSWPDKLIAINSAQIQAVAKKYLQNNNSVTGKLIYDAQAQGGKGAVNANLSETANLKTENNSKSANTSTKGGIKAEEIILPNGLKLILRQNPNLPIVAISGSIDAGESFDHKFGKVGISSLTALALQRGTQSKSKDQIDDALEQMGAEISFSGDRDYVSLSAKGLSKDLKSLLDLLSEQIAQPAFSEEEFNKLKVQVLAGLSQSQDSLGALAKIGLYQAIYSKDHPFYELSLPEQIESVKSINTSDLKAFHSAYYEPNRTIIAISGDFDKKEILEYFNKVFAEWSNNEQSQALKYSAPIIEIEKAKPSEKTTEIAGKSQAVVILGYGNSVKRSDSDFYALLVANDILGGGSTLSSRLGKSVREEAGLVYSIASSFDMRRGAGPFIIQMGVPPQKIDKALELTKAELEKFKKVQVTDEELERAKNYRSGVFISNNLTTNENVADALVQYSLFGLDLNTINEYPAKIQAVQKADIVRVANKYIFPDKLNIIIVKPKP